MVRRRVELASDLITNRPNKKLGYRSLRITKLREVGVELSRLRLFS